jgi:hypothetical protein
MHVVRAREVNTVLCPIFPALTMIIVIMPPPSMVLHANTCASLENQKHHPKYIECQTEAKPWAANLSHTQSIRNGASDPP